MTINIFKTALLRHFQQYTFSLLLLQQCTAFILFPSILAKAPWLLLKINVTTKFFHECKIAENCSVFYNKFVAHWKTARFSEFLNCYHMFSTFCLKKQILETPKNQYLKSWHLGFIWNVEVTYKDKRQWK